MSAQIKIIFISNDDQLAYAYLHISAVKNMVVAFDFTFKKCDQNINQTSLNGKNPPIVAINDSSRLRGAVSL